MVLGRLLGSSRPPAAARLLPSGRLISRVQKLYEAAGVRDHARIALDWAEIGISTMPY
jgi:hypothetical protein